jgi:hypothetical protein
VHGSVSFTATCTDQGGGDFEVKLFAESSETGATLGRQADHLPLDPGPVLIDSTMSSTAAVRQTSATVVTPSTAFNVLMARGVMVGGQNCVAGVTVLP